MNIREALERRERPPAATPAGAPSDLDEAPGSRLLRIAAGVLLATGLAAWAFDAGILALWLFAAAAAAIAWLLPLPIALVSPLFMGIAGWLVDMLPFVILAGWAAVVLRWALGLLRERRLPRGGAWRWVSVALVAWTALGVIMVETVDLKHFALLLAIQVLSSGTLFAVIDCATSAEVRLRIARGLLVFAIVLSLGVFMAWVGVPLEALQDTTVSERVEEAYGLDAFPNNVGMVKYTRARNAGAGEMRARLEAFRAHNESLPGFSLFSPKFRSYGTDLVVRFHGSARPLESELRTVDVDLLYDNVGLVPGNSVPRMRSFPRNALTYAGVCAALFPLGFYYLWARRRKGVVFGLVAIASCLFGAAFSLARGAWLAILIGAIYLLVDGSALAKRRWHLLAAFAVAGVVITGVFFVKYESDPLTARAGATGSVNSRQNTYDDTIGAFSDPLDLLLGYGVEKSRSATGASDESGRYIPRAGTHSTYLNYLFRTGLPGGLAIIVLYGGAVAVARRASRSAPEDRRTLASLVTAAALIAAAHAVILSLFVEPVYTLTVSLLLGLAIATGMETRGSLLPWRSSDA